MGAMDLRVDRDAEVPLGTQLAWKLRRLIETGELGAGDRLPSVREAAAAAGVNVNTVRAVYGRLEREGLVSSEQGRGTFVRRAAEPAAGHGARAGRAARAAPADRPARVRAGAPAPAPHRGRASSAGRRRPAARCCPPSSSRTCATACSRGCASWTTPAPRCMRRLDELPAAEQPAPERRPSPSSSSLSGARVRWVGA